MAFKDFHLIVLEIFFGRGPNIASGNMMIERYILTMGLFSSEPYLILHYVTDSIRRRHPPVRYHCIQVQDQKKHKMEHLAKTGFNKGNNRQNVCSGGSDTPPTRPNPPWGGSNNQVEEENRQDKYSAPPNTRSLRTRVSAIHLNVFQAQSTTKGKMKKKKWS